MKCRFPPKSLIKKSLLLLVIFALGAGFGNQYVSKIQNKPAINIEQHTSRAFVSEIYDKVSENYWDNISDAQLLELFKLAIDRNGGSISVAKFENKDKLLTAIDNSITSFNEEQKSKFIVTVVSQVLASLGPNGRSGLFTQKNEEQLKNTIQNINPEKDLYKDLGLSKGASDAAVNQSFQQKAEELKKDKSPEAQEKIKQLIYAKDVLTNKDQKEKYDQNKIEPTIFTRIAAPGILYLQFKKFAPTSLEEFQKAFNAYQNNSELNALIFDLRGNIGGAIDQTAYLLGFFLGKGQYAFDFYRKGEYLPFKTQVDKLPTITKFKQVIVLVDQNTQSSAEMMAASLKKYHAGVVVGVPTKGWGTVERIFPLDNQISKNEKYSLFLVHSITLRDDNQPIEGRGVDPDVNTKDPNWSQKLLLYFNNPSLVSNVTKALNGNFSN